MIRFSVLLGVALLLVCASAYKTGAPNMACKALEPKHKDWKGQDTPSPYKIAAKKSGEYIEVTIADPKGGEKFKGFLLVARDASGKNVGTWELVDKAKLLKCDNENVSRFQFLFSIKALLVSANGFNSLLCMIESQKLYKTNLFPSHIGCDHTRIKRRERLDNT